MLTIDKMKLTARTRNALMNASVYTAEDLECMTESMLMRIPNLGRKSLIELKDACERFGIELMDQKYKEFITRYEKVIQNNMDYIRSGAGPGKTLMKFDVA